MNTTKRLLQGAANAKLMCVKAHASATKDNQLFLTTPLALAQWHRCQGREEMIVLHQHQHILYVCIESEIASEEERRPDKV